MTPRRGFMVLFTMVILGAAVFWILGKGSKPSDNLLAQIVVPEHATSIVSTASAPRTTTTLIAVGDVMLGRFVETLMKRHGADYPFEKISSTLAGADAVVGNLEGVINTNHTHSPNQTFAFSFPPIAADVLSQNHFSVMSLGNNHAYDFGRDGFLDTEKVLRARGIVPVGNPYASAEEYVYTGMVGGRETTFASLNATFPHFSDDAAAALVDSLRQKHPQAFLVVFMHWGAEYQLQQSEAQTALAHRLVDAGADLILGSHPHVVQGVEIYKEKPIFYSLGNFIFDQYFSKDVQEGLMVKIAVGDAEVSYQLVPLTSALSQPELVAGDPGRTFSVPR